MLLHHPSAPFIKVLLLITWPTSRDPPCASWKTGLKPVFRSELADLSCICNGWTVCISCFWWARVFTESISYNRSWPAIPIFNGSPVICGQEKRGKFKAIPPCDSKGNFDEDSQPMRKKKPKFKPDDVQAMFPKSSMKHEIALLT